METMMCYSPFGPKRLDMSERLNDNNNVEELAGIRS